jgi:hypothetical protein
MKSTSTLLMRPSDSSAYDSPRENHPDGACQRSDAESAPSARHRMQLSDELIPRLAFESHHGAIPCHYGPPRRRPRGCSLEAPKCGQSPAGHQPSSSAYELRSGRAAIVSLWCPTVLAAPVFPSVDMGSLPRIHEDLPSLSRLRLNWDTRPETRTPLSSCIRMPVRRRLQSRLRLALQRCRHLRLCMCRIPSAHAP